MSVTIHLHPDMIYRADDKESVETRGSTVGECIDHLLAQYPGLYDLIFYKDGGLQSFLEVYVNRRAATPNELSWPVQDGDEIHLVFTIAGG